VAATASSEYDTLSADKLIDDDISGPLAHTSSHLPGSSTDNFAGKGVGQKCPWWQLDLGETKTVDKVKLSAPKSYVEESVLKKDFGRMRRLLYVLDCGGSGGAVPFLKLGTTMSDTVEDTILSQGGVRVLVGDSPRDRAETSSQIAAGHWPGTGMGSVCPVPPTGEECETIQCENAANCLDRFIGEAQDTEIGTAVVECNGKQGRYVTIELYGETRW